MLHAAARWVHIGGGFAAVAVGLVVMLLPKFGRRARWHRWLGRVYAACIGGSSLVGVPLSLARGNYYLVVLGALTLLLVVTGWRDAIRAARATAEGDRDAAARHLRWHLILMGASYIGAWSGFFANNFIFGTDAEWKIWFYAVGPSVIGAPVIAFAALRLPVRPRHPTL